MCGIAGILKFADDGIVDESHLRLMAGELRHRGPDDEGIHVDPQKRCGLAFRRLSIIDVAGGHQPLSNEDGTVWLVFNGEIYNFRDLRRSLTDLGHAFATHTDSEVAVHAYEQWGDEFVARLHGMFALAIWDSRNRRLLLARDRLGKKPLFYAADSQRVCFASESKALLALPDVPRALDATALAAFLFLQYVPAGALNGSAFRGVQQLAPGHAVVFSLDGRDSRMQQPYWHVPRGTERFPGSYADAKHRLGELLTAAVEKRLVADVPLGAFLSGGVDSSIVVGLMRKLGVSPLRTFSIRFDDRRYDESGYARLVARHFRTEHHEQTVTPRAREIVETLAYHFDQPFADSSAVPTYYVARHAREHVTVALTGDGGDECFGGYDRYRAAALCAQAARAPRWLRRSVAALGRVLPHGAAKSLGSRLHRLLSVLDLSAADRYLSWVCVFEDELDLFTTAFLDRAMPAPGAARALLTDLYDRAGGGAAQRAIYTDFRTYLPFDLLTKVDIASMACSLECRSPLLDHELVEFAQSLPIEWRLGRRGGKRILKDWARELLPAESRDRPEMGLGVPVGEWFRRELAAELRDTLTGRDSLASRIFRMDRVRQLIDEHQSSRANHEHRLWLLYMLEHWRRRWQPALDL
ncbi:MAG: asparagine synthase (glutamine-hydrolyzing) [Planctomycetes bacterium]|nr:asparagine synthase (glutamine-hydrolyzing) [Planctomycetota bacterium]